MSKKKSGVVCCSIIIIVVGVLLGVFNWLTSPSPIGALDKTDLQSGEVKISKTAKKVSGMVNQWDITVRVEGKDQVPPPSTDIVLIVDTSGSMEFNSRMEKAKEAAHSFVDEILKEGYENRIALITYGDDVTSHTYSSNNNFVQTADKNELHDTIDQLVPEGGTYTQKALSTAADLIAKSTAKRRYIVLISDGVPTYSCEPAEKYTKLENMEQIEYKGDKAYQTVKTIPESDFNYGKRVGGGSSFLWYIETNPDGSISYYNNANSTIAQANIIKEKKLNPSSSEPLIYDLYTIGVDLDLTETGADIEVGNQTIKEIASKDKSFSVNSDQLKDILAGIAGEIVGAIKSALVVDPMGTGFILDGDVKTTQGTTRISGNTINWTMSALIKEDLAKDPTGAIKYAEMTYRVSATDGVLAAGVIDANGLAKTNGITTIGYIDYKDETNSKKFEVPSVKPIIVTLKKRLVDMNDEEIQSKETAFNFVVGEDAYTKNDSFTLYSGESKQWVHPWQEGKEYTIEEDISEDEYEVKININGETTEAKTAKFKFQLINDEYEPKPIIVQNRKLPSFKTAWLNIRQSVINEHEDLVIPSKGYYKLMDEGAQGQESRLVSGSTNLDSADKVTQTLFTKYQYNLNKENLKVKINDLIPEYYTIFGHIVTATDNNLGNSHISTNKSNLILTNDISLDYQVENEYWVTVFITPRLGEKSDGTKEDSPRPYSWSYRINQFGE